MTAVRTTDRALGALVLALMIAGSFVLWFVIPLVVLWALGQAVDSPQRHLVLALLTVPSVMVMFAALLTYLNLIYLRLHGIDVEDDSDDPLWRPRMRAPLDRILGSSAILALLVLLGWILFGPHVTPNAVM